MSGSPFSRYQVFGILIPGATLLLGLWLLFPSMGSKAGVSWHDLTLGGLGIFAIASFCAGQIVQAPANVLSDFLWKYFGRPTEQMRRRGAGLADPQVKQIPDAMNKLLGFELTENTPDEQWRAATAAMAALVTEQDKTGRLLEFNGSYGLHRGLTVSLLILVCVAGAMQQWTFLGVALAGSLATAYRMRRFSRYYARELWIDFLSMARENGSAHKP